VLDSTVFGGDRYLESAAGRVLRDESEAGRLRIAVPTVVLLESDANHRRAVLKANEQLIAARDKLEQLRAPQAGDLRPRKLQYRQEIEELVRAADSKLLPIPDVPHATLIEKAVNRIRPFDSNGDGYRDTLVWHTILELLEVVGDRVILISNDRAAFSDSKDRPRLAADLVNELADLGQASRVSLYFEVRDLTAELPEAQQLVDDWSRILSDNPNVSDALTAYVLKLGEEEGTAVIGAANQIAGARNGRFVTFSNPRDRRVAEAWVGPDGNAVLDVVITVDYDQEFEVPYSPATPADSTAPTQWVTVTASGGKLTLRFELIQRDRNDPTRFIGRLVGWRDHVTGKQGGEPPSRSQGG